MKQAVVLIHGVGEQVPMDTLRGFVDTVWCSDSTLRWPNQPAAAWSKPDDVSGDLELRRLTTATNRAGKRTDFFEFYWAHLMEGTTLSHVGAWAKVLIFRWPWRVPPQLRGLWFALVLLMVVGLVIAFNQAFSIVPISPAFAKVASGVSFGLGFILTGVLINIAGDAARYLHVAPANIKIRRRIRIAGIQLLDKLHASGTYDRIVVVGHSLGSVIGYDILTHLWARYHDDHASTSNPAGYPALEALEALAEKCQSGQVPIDEYQTAQATYLKELKGQNCKWLVSDFITLGSPLTHAGVLMARNSDEFNRKTSEREYPTCPPALEKVEEKMRFSFKPNGKVWVPHHGAVFAPTRWTNFYFPCRFTLWGDVIGGPVAPNFGPCVRDVPVSTKKRMGIFTHTFYWDLQTVTESINVPEYIKALRKAMRICEDAKADTPP